MEKKKRDRDGYGFQEVAHEEDPQGDGGGSGEGEGEADADGGVELTGELWIGLLFLSFPLLGFWVLCCRAFVWMLDQMGLQLAISAKWKHIDFLLNIRSTMSVNEI